MTQKAKKHMQQIFHQSQFSVTSHERLFKQLKHLYDEMPPESFLEEFTRCLQVPLVYGDKHKVVENTLNFACKFIATFLQLKPVNPDKTDTDDEEELCPFVINILRFLFDNHSSENQSIRFRVCQFINKILNSLGNEACIEDYLCDQICDCMMESLQDRAPAVRMQAVLALHRLQDPLDTNCPVMKAFIFHMKSDPNPDVRRAVLTNIAITSQSVKAILERTHDTKDSVRKTAYICLSKLGVQRFSITQRVRLLTNGFKDHSAIVRDCVSKVMVPAWLQIYKGSFLSLLHALDCENSTETSSQALQALFKTEPIKKVLEELTNLLNDDKVIPSEQLTPENVLYWRMLTEYLEAHPDVAEDRPIDEPLPEILPELSTFCNYIKQYHEVKIDGEVEDWMKLQKQYTLIQLLELCKSFDLADEMGRTNLRNLCLYFLTNNAVSEEVVPILVQLMVKVVPNVEDRLQALAEAISEVREPMTEQEPEASTDTPPCPALSTDALRQRELKQAALRVKINELKEEQDDAIRDQDFMKAQSLQDECLKLQSELKSLIEVSSVPAAAPSANPSKVDVRDPIKDEAALRKCLCIVREMVKSESVKSLSATLRSLMQNFVLPCLQEDNSPVIRNKALEALGLFCLLDKSLAQENFLMFCFQIASDEVCEVALKVTFDLLLLYGLETFHIQDDSGETSVKKKSKKRKNLFATDMFEDDFDTEEEEGQETTTNISSGSSGNTSSLISMLTSLLDSASTSMRNLAMEGLYKLLMACRITSSALLSRLILMWYSPVTDGDEHLRQPLGVFLTVYASRCPRSQETFEQAFLPTLRTLMQAPVTSPLTAIDQDSVARLFINLTRPGINKYHSKMSHIHNNLAISICNAIMDSDDCTNIGVLLKALSSLELSLDDAVYREELKTLIKNIREIFLVTKERAFLRYLVKLTQMVENAENTSMRTTEVDNTAAVSQLEGTDPLEFSSSTVVLNAESAPKRNENAKLLQTHMHSSTSDNEVDEEDEDESIKTLQNDCDIVIPPSPPQTQCSDEEDNDSMEEQKRMQKSSKAPGDDGLFKKPAVKLQQQNEKKMDNRGKASSSGSDSSPVVKRRRNRKEDQSSENKSKQLSGPLESTESELSEDDQEKNKQQMSSGRLIKAQKRKVPPVKRAVQKNKELESAKHVMSVRESKRIIHPTEKGATLKSFQSLNVVMSPESSKSMSPSSASSSDRPSRTKTISKRAKTFEKEDKTSTNTQRSGTSSKSTLTKTPSSRPSTRHSLSFSHEENTSDSSLTSAAVLNRQRAQKRATTTLPRKNELKSAVQSSTLLPPTRHLKKPKDKTVSVKSVALPTVSSSPDVDSDSSPLPRRRRLGDVETSQKKQETPPPRSRREPGDSSAPAVKSPHVKKAAALPPSKQPKTKTPIPSLSSSGTDSEEAPVFMDKPRRSLRQNNDSPQVIIQSERSVQSPKTSKLDVAIEGSSPSTTIPRASRQRSSHLGSIEKLKDKPAAAVRVIVQKMSVMEKQVSSSDLSSEIASASPRTRRSVAETKGRVLPQSDGRQRKILRSSGTRSNISDEIGMSNVSLSPKPLQSTKKRTAEVLKSTSSESVDSESPQSSSKSRGSGKMNERSRNIALTQPGKKLRNKTPSEDSPLSSASRRSLRSQTETPSPRTRSGKVLI